MVIELKYSNTNTYLIRGKTGSLLLDTAWAGTFPLLCRALGENNATLREIKHLLITHYHPDHMGIAQEIAEHGIQIIVPDVQRDFLHAADDVFEKEKNSEFRPINDNNTHGISLVESRTLLAELGIGGEILHTPGHSDDSISLLLDDGSLFVGDLAPLYELELHKGSQTAKSWEMLLKRDPKQIYYGHARSANIGEKPETDVDLYSLTKKIVKCVKRGYTAEKIQRKTGADETFIADVARMYVTHRDITIQGILDRIEIKGK